jgi:hypothetical protein
MGQLGSTHPRRGAPCFTSISYSPVFTFRVDRQVGAYGEVENETGELRVDGNIYDPEFQAELNRLGLTIRMADHPPEEGGVEDDFIVSSKGAKRIDLSAGPDVCVSRLSIARPI